MWIRFRRELELLLPLAELDKSERLSHTLTCNPLAESVPKAHVGRNGSQRQAGLTPLVSAPPRSRHGVAKPWSQSRILKVLAPVLAVAGEGAAPTRVISCCKKANSAHSASKMGLGRVKGQEIEPPFLRTD
jgi:hypothetical protein